MNPFTINNFFKNNSNILGTTNALSINNGFAISNGFNSTNNLKKFNNIVKGKLIRGSIAAKNKENKASYRTGELLVIFFLKIENNSRKR